MSGLSKSNQADITTAKNVVTISRQMGSLGWETAKAAAGLLEYKLVWRDLINEAARRCGQPEVALIAIDELNLLGLRPSTKAFRAYTTAVKQIMKEYADHGETIIVGRAGQTILRGRSNVLHVRIVAPMDIRAERIAASMSVSTDCARARIEASDRFRKRYLKRFYAIDWSNPEIYDLVINTEHITARQAAQLIQKALRISNIPSPTPSAKTQETFIEP